MNYYYDIVLNLNEELYEFYEWEENDSIDFIKKIPLFRVSTKTLKDNLKYQTKFSQTMIEQIKNKTIIKKNENLENIFLISDTKNALALEINNEGLVINRSKLLVSDEMNLIEMIYSLKEVKIEYEKIKKYEARKELRQIEKIKKLIKCEIDLLYQEKNRSKLKYLYYEWFNTVENSLEKMYEEMNTELEKNFSEKLNNIYDLIKLSYHKISG
ncbi:MAG: DUF3603 family protein [Bacilli bacterium]|nr:DUF3603 family protein [Bacilli bacterium]